MTLDLPGALHQYCGGARQLRVAAQSIRALLSSLERDQPALHRNLCDEQGAVRRHLNVFVNTDNIRDRDGLDTSLCDGDVVIVLPAVSGG